MDISIILPLLAPFIIGLLIGVLIKKTINIVIIGIALLIVLIATGVISITYRDIYDKAMETLPEILSETRGWIGVLPYSSISFLIGLSLGLWKG